MKQIEAHARKLALAIGFERAQQQLRALFDGGALFPCVHDCVVEVEE